MESDISSTWKEIQKSSDPLDYINFLNLYSFIEGKYGPIERQDILKEAFKKLQKFFLKFIQNNERSRILSTLEALAIKLSASKSLDTLGFASSLLFDLSKMTLNDKMFELSAWFAEKSIFLLLIGKLFTSIYGLVNVVAANAWLGLKKPEKSLNYSKIAVRYCEEMLQKQNDEVPELQKCLFLSYFAYAQSFKKLKDLNQANIWFDKAKRLRKLRPGIAEDTEIALKILKLESNLRKTSVALPRRSSQKGQDMGRTLKNPKKSHQPKPPGLNRRSSVYQVEPYTLKNIRPLMQNLIPSSDYSKKSLPTLIVFPKFNDSKSSLNKTFSQSSQNLETSSSKSSSFQSEKSGIPMSFKGAERVILKRPILQLSEPKSHQITPTEFERILVTSQKAYFMYVQCDFSFYYTKQSKIITTVVQYNNQTFSLDTKMTAAKGLTNFITEDILPYLDLVNNKLVLGQLVKINFLEGYFYLNGYSGLLKFTIQQPRSDFLAEAYASKSVMTCLSQITTFTDKLNVNFFEIPREKFLTFYTIEEKTLKVDLPLEDKMELLYYNKELTVHENDFFVKISVVNFLKDQKFLIESINAESRKVSYCVVNKEYLKVVYGIQEQITGRNIDVLAKLLTVKFGQVKLHLKAKEGNIPKILRINNQSRKKKVTKLQSFYRGYSVRKGNAVSKGITIYLRPKKQTSILSFIYSTQENCLKLNLFHKHLEYSLNLFEPIPFKLPYFRYLSRYLSLDHFPQLKLGRETLKFSIVYKDVVNTSDLIFDRLIFRTGLRINSKHYIVSMSLSKSYLEEIMLVFKLQHNVFSDSISIITIDLDTISEKTEIPKQNLISIAYYVSKYMLVVKGPDLLYIDLSKSKIDLSRYAQRIQANYRGYWTRKRLPKVDKKKIIIKKKVSLKGENWTIMFFEKENEIVLNMVRGINVLTLCLDKVIIEAHCSLSTLDYYITESLIPAINIKYRNGKPVIYGLESLKTCLDINN